MAASGLSASLSVFTSSCYSSAATVSFVLQNSFTAKAVTAELRKFHIHLYIRQNGSEKT